MNITAQEQPMDFGGRYLKNFDFMEEVRKQFKAQQPEEPKFGEEEQAEQKPTHHRRHDGHGKRHHKRHHRPQSEDEDYDQYERSPCMRRFQDELDREQESRIERVGGMCPLCFLLIFFSAICQLCTLKRHARACKHLKNLKDW